jgi:predicted permease
MRIRWPFRGGQRFHDDLDEEIRVHLEMARSDRLDRGENPSEAERHARAEFGNALVVKEVTRDVWRWTALDNLGQDLKYALRQTRRSPGYCAVAIVTLAFGIGVNTTMFSLVNAILFQPMHARNPEHVVAVFSSVNPDAPYGSSSYLEYLDIRSRTADMFQDLAAYTLMPADLKMGEGAQHLSAGIVSGNYFRMLGAGALLGRTFAPEEDRPFDPRRVAILSERMWRERFGADPSITGKTIRLNNQGFTVIGVVDSKFCRLRHFFETDLFIPAAAKDLLSARAGGASRGETTSRKSSAFGQQSLTSRKARQFFLVGRLADGVGVTRAQARLRVLASELYREQPEVWSSGHGRPGTITVVSEADSRVPPQARLGVIAFSIFVLAIVGTVLLIACANLANLSLARALNRRTEIAVRVSVGASRWRLIRQLLVESLLLSAMGAAAAILLTRWAVQLLAGYRAPMEISLGLDLVIDGHVLLFALLITLATTLLFGLAPALHATGSDVVSALKETGIPGPYRKLSFRSMLIVAEVALSIVLLMPSGLFFRSLQNFRNLDIGFKRDHLALVSITLDPERYSPERGNQAYRDIVERLRRIPGVEHADFATTVPLNGVSNTQLFVKEGAEQSHEVESNTVGPHYFETMGIPFLRGQGFDGIGRDRAVAVVNAAFARAFWPGEDAIGKRITLKGEPTMPIEVIGVVATGKYASVTETPTPYIYRPMAQDYSSSATFHIRTRVSPRAVLSRLATEIQAYDASLPVFDAKTMEDQLAFTVAPYEAVALILGIFGLLALVIAFAGLYGLIAYQTAVRTREIGIRVALGANPRDILTLMVSEGLRLVFVGVAAGVPASIAVALLISKFLFGIAPLDPETYVAIPLLMGMVAVTAITIPAVRCMRIEPWGALRTN